MKVKKIRNQRGFTLVEMLVTLIILGFVTLCVASGITTAIRCYQDLMFQSESRLLISSLNESVKDTLRYASSVSTVPIGGNTPNEDVYEKVKEFYFYKEKYSKNDNSLSKYESTEGQFSDETGQLKLKNPFNDSVLGGEGIYSQSLYVEGFTLEFCKKYNIFRFSYTVRDKRNSSHKTKSGLVYVNSLMKK
ncbi:MAG: type II secretion system protein [Lachnospiraceae bacterium]